MRRALIWFSAVFVPAVLLATFCLSVRADDTKAAKPAAAEVQPAVDEVMAVVKLVLENHISPPTGQQMVLDVIRQVHQETKLPMPLDVPQQISKHTTDDLPAYLTRYLTELSGRYSQPLRPAVRSSVDIMITNLPGGARLNSAREHAVSDQIASNRYVGTGIALTMSGNEKLPAIAQVFQGGPIDQAGGKAGDVISEIDGMSTQGKTITEVVEMLRGPDGSDITLVVHQPDQPPRTLAFQRGVVNFPSISKPKKLTLPGPTLIGYLKIERISASLVHELRKAEQTVRLQEVSGIVIDLRDQVAWNVHHAVLLADALLDGGAIGQVRTRSETRTYQAEPEALFNGLPMAVIVNRHTSGAAEWIAAALQDRRRALIVGEHTAGRGYGQSAVAIPGTDLVVTLPTAELLRADGKSLIGVDRTTQHTVLVLKTRDEQSRRIDPLNRKTVLRSLGAVVPDHPLDDDRKGDIATAAAEILLSTMEKPAPDAD